MMKTASLKTRINPTGYLRLWDAPDDPWTGTTSRLSLLGQLSNHWNSNMRSQRRTAVHMVRWGRSELAVHHAASCHMRVFSSAERSVVHPCLASVLFIRALHHWSSSVPCVTGLHPVPHVSPAPANRSGKQLGGGTAWMFDSADNLKWATACSSLLGTSSSSDYCEPALLQH